MADTRMKMKRYGENQVGVKPQKRVGYQSQEPLLTETNLLVTKTNL